MKTTHRSALGWAILPLRRYAEFRGRSRRKEYWLFLLLYLVAALAYVAAFFALAHMPGPTTQGIGLLVSRGLLAAGVLTWLGLLVPSVAVQARRLHDQDKTAWLLLLVLIPYLGTFILLIFMAIDGTRGSNRFGPDPRQDGDDPVADRIEPQESSVLGKAAAAIGQEKKR